MGARGGAGFLELGGSRASGEGVGFVEGVSPSPMGVESGEGAVPPPQKIFGFLLLK